MKLRDLVDLEWLLRDPAHLSDDVVRGAQVDAVAAVDGRRAAVDENRSARVRVCMAVLAAARRAQVVLPGPRLEHAIRTAGVLLVVFGLLFGGGAAFGLLAYDGKTPVNVLHFVLVLFVGQIVLLVLLLWFMVASRGTPATDASPHRLVAWLVDRLLGARGRTAAELLQMLRTRHALYRGIERWTLFALVQRFGIAFNVGALAVTMLLVSGTDLTFSWSTTLSIGGREVHAFTTALAAPWWFWDAGVPSLATVDGTQWTRMPGEFVHPGTLAEQREHAAAWWRFLAAGLIAYGLLPRTAALVFGSLRRSTAMRAVGLDHAAFHGLYDRVLPRHAAFSGPDAASIRGAAPADDLKTVTPHAPHQPDGRAVLLCWGSAARAANALRDVVTARWSNQVVATAAAGGKSLADDERALALVAEHAPQRVVVVFAPGQQPTADSLAFLRSVRKRLGAKRPLVVVLATASADGSLAVAEESEHAIWRRSLGSLGDAYLWLEALEASR